MQDFYDVEAAASRLKMHRGSLLRALRRGSLDLTTYEAPATRTHRKYYFRKPAVDALVAQRAKMRQVRR